MHDGRRDRGRPFNEKAGLGLTGVSLLMSALLAVVLVVQFRTTAYRAGVYWLAAAPFALAVGAVALALAHRAPGLGAVVSFWIAYVLTRPLGASIGDHLSQPTGDGGIGLGTVVPSALLLAVILGLVVHLAVTRKDVIEPVAKAV